MKLKGKVALITGAGRGMGKAEALLFAQEGADIAVNDIDSKTAKETAEAVKKLGRRAIAVQADVAEPAQVDAMIERVIKELGGINILVNNAGIVSGSPTIDETVETWKRILGVHLGGAFFCSRRVGRWMINKGGGRIVNISSLAGIMGLPEIACYGPAKAALINLTRVLAVEWGKYNIRVNAIAPGSVRTPMHDEGIKQGGPSDEVTSKAIPLGRIAEPEEIARAVLFLVSDDSSYITGVTLPVDGGWLAHGSQSL